MIEKGDASYMLEQNRQHIIVLVTTYRNNPMIEGATTILNYSRCESWRHDPKENVL